ncbi:hypothetical protein TNIN_41261 [Trichonephila inaurata madagascariensis]|uniref:Uncharacterized protein n=1 Tax=Trichonephila inaurata madagascariensis TaxID=2747483 RepID=A0A8X7CGP1_9ARAC|nr:hypothetical protein TNIN_41261 [Trichonephila inaurata madagascariensis]
MGEKHWGKGRFVRKGEWAAAVTVTERVGANGIVSCASQVKTGKFRLCNGLMDCLFTKQRQNNRCWTSSLLVRVKSRGPAGTLEHGASTD